MKVLQVPFTYHPDVIGGTETYVRTLALGLRALNVESVICAPGRSDSASEHDGIRVHRFRVMFGETSSLYGYPRSDVAAFGGILDTEEPDLVHFHAFVGGLTPGLAVQARRRRIPMVYTYHTPTALCTRGDLLRMGKGVCEGLLEPKVCASCTMRSRGAPVMAIATAGLLPAPLKSALARVVKGRYRTALTLEADLGRHRASFEDFVSGVEHVVAVCEWAIRLLRVNGVPESKLLLCRHGVEPYGPVRSRPGGPGGPLKFLYAGRLNVDKGLDVAIKALRSLRGTDVSLDIRGATQSDSDRRYVSQLKLLCGDDPRVRFMAPYAPQESMEVMAQYDALLVPSVGMETGPLVVLEAFAAGLPVLASRRGGMRELIAEGVDGLLAEPGDVQDWSRLFSGILKDPGRLDGLRRKIRPPRTVADVSAQMRDVYARALVGDARS